MAFTRPTLAALIDRIQSDVEAELAGVTARLRRTVERALAKGVAGLAHGLHGHLAWIANQIIADTADEDSVLRWSDFFGLTRVAAVATVQNVTVTGTGGTLPAGTLVARAADGSTYTVNSTLTSITSTTGVVTAVTPGAAANLTAGQTISLVSPIANVSSTLTVLGSATTLGTDVETIPALLVRLLDRIQHPPMGGARGDHVAWALEVAGVTRAWEYAGTNGAGNPALGKVALTFVRDNDGTGAAIIPDSGEVAAVQAYLDARSPAQVIVFAPTAVAFDYSVTLTPNGDSAVEAAVEAEVADMLAREAIPGGTIDISRLNEAISEAQGEVSHILNSPVANVTHTFGQIAVYGTPTFP